MPVDNKPGIEPTNPNINEGPYGTGVPSITTTAAEAKQIPHVVIQLPVDVPMDTSP